jgi:hypothetical protein
MSNLEKASHIAVLLLCVTAAGAIVRREFVKPHTPVLEETSAALLGKRLPLSGAVWNRANIVIALSSHCQFCAMSLPLYHDLTTAHRPQQGRETETAIFVVSSEPSEMIAQFLAAAQVQADKIFTERLSELKVRGTPTVVLVDEGGVVKRVFVGKLQAHEERELLEIARTGRL